MIGRRMSAILHRPSHYKRLHFDDPETASTDDHDLLEVPMTVGPVDAGGRKPIAIIRLGGK